jgi:uncharacterized protein (TIGR03437 family)
VPAPVLYAGGAPGMVVGVIQVNLRIPDGTATGPSVPIVLYAGDRASQSGLTISIQSSDRPAMRPLRY